jgi:hypothetical protein
MGKEGNMQISIVQMILMVISVAGVGGCAEFSHPMSQGEKSIRELSAMPRHLQDLAGVWEYEDKSGSYTVVLDQEGNGTYEWENGWLETHELNEGVWTGKWFQTGNDREGGFELQWSDNAAMAKGRWWYTRIGQDQNPLEPGGTFTMKRISSLVSGRK